METSFILRRALQAILPVTLLLSACGKKEDVPAPTPVPDRGRVLISHAAAASPSQLSALINSQQVGQVNYGQSTAYLNVNAGTSALSINTPSGVAVQPQPLVVAKDQNYSSFIYSPTSGIGSTALLTVTDDLSAPSSGVKVRLVHLAVGAPNPVRLTVPSPTPGGAGTDLTADVAFGTVSSFVLLNAGPQNLIVTSAGTPRPQVVVVGDGTGTGTGTKNYEAGKIYTIVVRGITGAAVPTAQQPQAVIIQNN